MASDKQKSVAELRTIYKNPSREVKLKPTSKSEESELVYPPPKKRSSDEVDSLKTPKAKRVSKQRVDLSITPSRAIALTIPTPERSHFFDDIKKEDTIIKELEERQDGTDKIFRFFDLENNPQIGEKLEYWTCVNIKCPCGGTFKKYESMSQPVIDVECSNPLHISTLFPKYYQIKATEQDKTFRGQSYFKVDKHNVDPQQNYVYVGSPRFGFNSHITDGTNLDIIIGYILITYIKKEDTFIEINKLKSFIIIPQINLYRKGLQYYTYLKQHQIGLYVSNHIINSFDKLGYIINNKVNLATEYELKGGYYSKYLKYKLKYLGLKDMIYNT